MLKVLSTLFASISYSDNFTLHEITTGVFFIYVDKIIAHVLGLGKKLVFHVLNWMKQSKGILLYCTSFCRIVLVNLRLFVYH